MTQILFMAPARSDTTQAGLQSDFHHSSFIYTKSVQRHIVMMQLTVKKTKKELEELITSVETRQPLKIDRLAFLSYVKGGKKTKKLAF